MSSNNLHVIALSKSMFRRGQPFIEKRRSHFAENIFVDKVRHVRDDHARDVPVDMVVNAIHVLEGVNLIVNMRVKNTKFFGS